MILFCHRIRDQLKTFIVSTKRFNNGFEMRTRQHTDVLISIIDCGGFFLFDNFTIHNGDKYYKARTRVILKLCIIGTQRIDMSIFCRCLLHKCVGRNQLKFSGLATKFKATLVSVGLLCKTIAEKILSGYYGGHNTPSLKIGSSIKSRNRYYKHVE